MIRGSGIYQITNRLSGESYIGSAMNLKGRWQRHLRALHRGQHHNRHLQRAFDKHGESALVFSVLEDIEEASQLIPREQYYLDMLNPEYNIAQIAGSTLGCRHSLEACARMSEARKGDQGSFYGKHHNPKTRVKISMALKGHTLSQETRRKISETLTGKQLSEKHRKNIGTALKGHSISAETRAKIGAANTGKHPSAETRAQISASLMGNQNAKGTIRSAEMRAKMSGQGNPMYGKHHSLETRAKMSAAGKGNPHPHKGHRQSEETRRKISERRKAYWQRVRMGLT